MSDFQSDLKEIPFVKCPANYVSQLYDQYVHDLSRILDRHAPLVSSLKTKQRADWLSETYRLAKTLRRQFEPAWHKVKSQYNRSRLRRQIAWYNRIANRDKTVYYRKLFQFVTEVKDVLKFLHYYYKQGIWMNQIFPYYGEIFEYLIFCELFYTETITSKDHSVF